MAGHTPDPAHIALKISILRFGPPPAFDSGHDMHWIGEYLLHVHSKPNRSQPAKRPQIHRTKIRRGQGEVKHERAPARLDRRPSRPPPRERGRLRKTPRRHARILRARKYRGAGCRRGARQRLLAAHAPAPGRDPLLGPARRIVQPGRRRDLRSPPPDTRPPDAQLLPLLRPGRALLLQSPGRRRPDQARTPRIQALEIKSSGRPKWLRF